MPEFVFRHVCGHQTVVRAVNEDAARHAAMVERYGPAPCYGVDRLPVILGSRYKGKGLTLVEIR